MLDSRDHLKSRIIIFHVSQSEYLHPILLILAVVSTASPKSAASQSPKTIPLQNPHQVIRERQPEPVSG